MRIMRHEFRKLGPKGRHIDSVTDEELENMPYSHIENLDGVAVGASSISKRVRFKGMTRRKAATLQDGRCENAESLASQARKAGMHVSTLKSRLNKGLSIDEAVKAPVMGHREQRIYANSCRKKRGAVF